MNLARAPFHALVIALTAWINLAHAVEPHYPPLGRLFTTPDMRAKLERQRQHNLQEARREEGGSVRLDGVVVRSSGKATVWLNGQPQTEAELDSGIQVKPHRRQPGAASVAIGGDPAVDLKVGATLDRASREASGGLSAGEIRIHRR
ncbi:MAG: hypothetical protein N3C63_00665 [Rhodocyclaceae bacterium]|nr:hypothetical protein [Rhodocyclaceae bacterium]